jgi:hypothetical protein
VIWVIDPLRFSNEFAAFREYNKWRQHMGKRRSTPVYRVGYKRMLTALSRCSVCLLLSRVYSVCLLYMLPPLSRVAHADCSLLACAHSSLVSVLAHSSSLVSGAMSST